MPRALITHAHGDHLVWGCERYLLTARGAAVARQRLGPQWAPHVETVAYGEVRHLNGVRISFHPAGHILGSAQIRLEHGGDVWVVSGDYKTDVDPTCDVFEPVRCRTFITESTFGLPIYRWDPQQAVFDDINRWWNENADAGITSIIYGYALGKAQRLIAGLDSSIGPILTHGAVETMTQHYREAGAPLPATTPVLTDDRTVPKRALVVAPPSANGSAWTRRFGDSRAAFASGWMRVRGARRRQAVDRGFTLSDHVDWPQLCAAIDATGAESVWVTHGFTEQVVRWLSERGRDARVIATRFEGEHDQAAESPP